MRAIEIEIAGAKDTLATKHDLLVLRQDFDGLGKIAKQGGEVRAEVAGVIRQMYLAILGQRAVLLGFAY